MAQIISWDATLVAVVAGLVVLAGPLLTLDVVRGRQESVAVTDEALENEDILCQDTDTVDSGSSEDDAPAKCAEREEAEKKKKR